MRTWSSSFGARPSFAMCCVPVRIVGFNVVPDLSGGGSCWVKNDFKILVESLTVDPELFASPSES